MDFQTLLRSLRKTHETLQTRVSAAINQGLVIRNWSFFQIFSHWLKIWKNGCCLLKNCSLMLQLPGEEVLRHFLIEERRRLGELE